MIFLRLKDRLKRATFDGSSINDLERVFVEKFSDGNAADHSCAPDSASLCQLCNLGRFKQDREAIHIRSGSLTTI